MSLIIEAELTEIIMWTSDNKISELNNILNWVLYWILL